VLFGAIVNYVGLALSTVILIVLSSAASPEFRPKESLVSGVALAVLSIAVFVIALKLQLPIWPRVQLRTRAMELSATSHWDSASR
jgi:hypothetical protein